MHNQKSKEKVDRTDKEFAISPHCRPFSNPQAHDFFSSQHFSSISRIISICGTLHDLFHI